MAGNYETAITISRAIANINNNDFLLPAIQRKFVWSSHQICVLFDSLMRGFPINSFMMWEVTDGEIKKNYKFYQFIKEYCKRFNEENPELATTASFKDFMAVIDGQQRLTSLYIGLCSTYAYKQPRTHWPSTKDDKKLPPRKLYLDLMSGENREDDNSLMHYRFRFLTDKQYDDSLKPDVKQHHWFCMHEVLNFPDEAQVNNVLRKIVMPYLSEHNLSENEFAEDTLLRVYEVFRREPVIHYFKESSQQIDHVLDVFIRTNSGGTKLDFSDLLMSIAVANWNGDFRKEIDSLVSKVHTDTEMGFYLGRDWVLKTCLMLTDADVKFKVKNFKAEQVEKIQGEWEEIKECIYQAFRLIRLFGIDANSLTSRNAVIPICYYLYKKKDSSGDLLYHSITNLAKQFDEREKISQWLYMALLKGVFGGQADTILASMRELLRNNIQDPSFPLDKIIEHYKGKSKDLRFDPEYLDRLLDMQYGEARCRALLHLLFPEMDRTVVFHIDHLHPQSAFDHKALDGHEFLDKDENLKAFYRDKGHWNSISNLHLLNDSQNLSKKHKLLSEWIGAPGVTVNRDTLLLEADASLAFEDFKAFYEARREALKKKLESRVYMASASSIVIDDTDEEQDDEEDKV